MPIKITKPYGNLESIALALGIFTAMVGGVIWLSMAFLHHPKGRWEVETPSWRKEFCGMVYTDGDNPVLHLVFDGQRIIVTGEARVTRLGDC